VTATPVRLVAAERVPHATPLQPEPLTDQFTPELSVVVGVSERVCVMVIPAFCGETETEMPEEVEIVNARFTDFVCTGTLESLTLMVRGVAPAAAVGVPVIAPVAPFSVRPAGKEPLEMDHV
jgi:hypothetical protein